MIEQVFGADATAIGFMRWYLKWPDVRNAQEALELRVAFDSVGAKVPDNAAEYVDADHKSFCAVVEDLSAKGRFFVTTRSVTA